MSKYAINPNAIPDEHAEVVAALDRDNAALHHFDDDGFGEGPLIESGPPLPPLMTTPDPRYPHGDIDAIEARLADLKKSRAAEASEKIAAHSACTPQTTPEYQAVSYPLVVSLLAALPEPHTEWTADGRADWLRAAESIFHLVYKTRGRVVVTAQDA
jgi:hypothetical protein